MPGDVRMAMTPLLGYREIYEKRKQQFKWMLLGDDDTIFFSRGIAAVTRDLDPNAPYFISGA